MISEALPRVFVPLFADSVRVYKGLVLPRKHTGTCSVNPPVEFHQSDLRTATPVIFVHAYSLSHRYEKHQHDRNQHPAGFCILWFATACPTFVYLTSMYFTTITYQYMTPC